MPVVARRTAAGVSAAGGEVQVWIADLDHATDVVDRLAGVLSPDERERAARFYFRRDATRFIVARATLRGILGGCLGVEPGALEFAYGPRGKPELGDLAGSDLQFSVSHSADVAVYAVTHGRRVGVDIERLRLDVEIEAIADGTFSLRERAALRRLPTAQRVEGFFNCWTRKEAYIKALGEGLAYPLERFSVSLEPDAPARLEAVDDDPAEAAVWTMEALALPPGFVGAVIVEGRATQLVCSRWEASAR